MEEKLNSDLEITKVLKELRGRIDTLTHPEAVEYADKIIEAVHYDKLGKSPDKAFTNIIAAGAKYSDIHALLENWFGSGYEAGSKSASHVMEKSIIFLMSLSILQLLISFILLLDLIF